MGALSQRDSSSGAFCFSGRVKSVADVVHVGMNDIEPRSLIAATGLSTTPAFPTSPPYAGGDIGVVVYGHTPARRPR